MPLGYASMVCINQLKRPLGTVPRCQASARTIAAYGVAASLRGGSARSSHRVTSAQADAPPAQRRFGYYALPMLWRTR